MKVCYKVYKPEYDYRFYFNSICQGIDAALDLFIAHEFSIKSLENDNEATLTVSNINTIDGTDFYTYIVKMMLDGQSYTIRVTEAPNDDEDDEDEETIYFDTIVETVDENMETINTLSMEESCPLLKWIITDTDWKEIM